MPLTGNKPKFGFGTEIGHVPGFCVYTTDNRIESDGSLTVGVMLCDPAICPCWYHKTRKENAA